MRVHKALLATARDVERATESTSPRSNKYSRGSVLIIGGSEKWIGAMKMASYSAHNALAALRSASGYVTIAAPKEILLAAGRFSPVYVLVRLKGDFGKGDLAKITGVRHNTLIFGPGIDPEKVNQSFLEKLTSFERTNGNAMVVDTSAFFRKVKKTVWRGAILTPHDGEFFKMTGISLKGKPLDYKIRVARSFAGENHCILVLKGHETVITDGDRVKVNVSKTPALATMGTGDVLAGIIASYAAIHKNAFESAVAGVYVHSRIGDLLFKKMGEHITAQDVIDALPKFLRKFDVVD